MKKYAFVMKPKLRHWGELPWKQVAKLWRRSCRSAQDNFDEMYGLALRSHETATRRLELLKEIIEMLGYCPFCWANAKQVHADDCELAKELADE